MRLNRLERHQQSLEHARWRVSFLLSLLASHRRIVMKRDSLWQVKESDYGKQLAAAQAELDRLDTLEVVRWREEPAAVSARESLQRAS